MFCTEIKVNGSCLRGSIKKGRLQNSRSFEREQYLFLSDIPQLLASKSNWTSDEIRSFADELVKVALKVDELNGVCFEKKEDSEGLYAPGTR